jgi:Protein of unknown function (DUF3037)
MPEQKLDNKTCPFDYSVIRIVPRVERSEFINAGVIVFARTLRYLDAKLSLDIDRLRSLHPSIDSAEIEQHLALIPKICAGASDAGPISELPQHERWHWLVAPRSTIIQTSAVHSGLTDNPQEELEQLMRTLVL